MTSPLLTRCKNIKKHDDGQGPGFSYYPVPPEMWEEICKVLNARVGQPSNSLLEQTADEISEIMDGWNPPSFPWVLPLLRSNLWAPNTGPDAQLMTETYEKYRERVSQPPSSEEGCPTCGELGPRNPKIWARLCPDEWHYPEPPAEGEKP